MNFQLIKDLSTGVWALEGNMALEFLNVLYSNKEGNPTPFLSSPMQDIEALNSSFLLSNSENGILRSNKVESESNVFVTSLSGPVLKNDSCGVKGTASMRAELMHADKQESVVAHIITIDSGGGSVNGLRAFSDAVSSLNKPVYGFIDGCACSAGYYMLAQCQEIFMSSSEDMTGSIGTMMAFRNYSNSKEVLGFEDVMINSNLSPDKNKEYMAAKEGDHEPMKVKLDAYASRFHEVVKAGRPNVKEGALTGKTFMADEALKMGLIDGVVSLEELAEEILNTHKNT